jgi:hypothetical protein
MRLRYVGGRPVLVKCPATGNQYRFSGVEPVRLVDPRDAITLARDPIFRIEGLIELSTDDNPSTEEEDGRYA